MDGSSARAVLVFDYRHADGSVRTRELGSWKEDGLYLSGIDATTRLPRTYRKDRIAAYLDGCERDLLDPHPIIPPVPVKHSRPSLKTPRALFTGFAALQRADLEAKAVEHGIPVCTGVTQSCLYVVAGPNAGPVKMAAARAAGKIILSAPQFRQMLETGELPPDDDEQDGLTSC